MNTQNGSYLITIFTVNFYSRMSNNHASKAPPVPKVEKEEVAHFGKDFLAALRYAQEVHGDLAQIPLGTSNMILASHPELAQQILIDQRDNFVKLGGDGRKTGLQAVLGQGLLTNSDKASWFEQRQMIQPMFHKATLEDMKLRLYETALQEIQHLEFGELDLYELALDITQKMIYQLLFSENIPASNATSVPINVPLRLATGRAKEVRQAVQKLRPEAQRYIDKRRNDQNKPTKPDLLDMLLAAQDTQGNRMNDEQLCDEILTIFSAGNETTASAISWSMYCLLKYPQCLDKLRSELDAIDNVVEDIDKLNYMQNVIKETLRLYPTIPAAPRSVLKHTVLNSYRVPQASKIFLSIYNIHRHGDFWEEPEAFIPERFDNLNLGHKLAYMPFGAGPRFCIGNHLAMLEATLVIVLLLQNFEFELLQENVATKVAISLFPKDGLVVAIKPKF